MTPKQKRELETDCSIRACVSIALQLRALSLTAKVLSEMLDDEIDKLRKVATPNSKNVERKRGKR